jgi:tRNA modification GTPase
MGMGGIGIVRMSGPRAIEISKMIFNSVSGSKRDSLKGYSIRYGKILDPNTGETLDEALLTVMTAPKTYTREDVVEINCHSGAVVLRKVLMTLVSLGARLAEPGEFTKRAYLNGRIDLAQAEAVMSLVSAKTDVALRTALQQLSGELSRKVNEIRSHLIHLLSEIEAAIDFPDEDLDLISTEEVVDKVLELKKDAERLIDTAEKGRILTEGISTAIVGKANVGKSSLLNRLLMEDRAIVTPYPGTTRDVIEATINAGGIPLRILDTAGIRDSADPVEQEGIKKSRECIDRADLVIMMIDISKDTDQGDLRIAQLLKDREKETILVLNKIDLVANGSNKGDIAKIKDIICPKLELETSITQNTGVNNLLSGISDLILEGKGGFGESSILTNVRHVSALISMKEALSRVLEGLKQGLSEEFISVDMRSALESLGHITGETTNEDVLHEIFRCFCVGK